MVRGRSVSLLLLILIGTVQGALRTFVSRCVDDDDAIFAASMKTMRCRDVFEKNGGTCSLAGPLITGFVEGNILTLAEAASLMELCPVTCKFCSPTQNCSDDNQQSQSQSGMSCSDMVITNEGNCDTSGPFLGTLSQLKADLTVQACIRSCLLCIPPCEDTSSSLVIQSVDQSVSSCADFVSRNGNFCSKSGFLVSNQSKEDDLKEICPASCRECAPIGTQCVDYNTKCNEMFSETHCNVTHQWWGNMTESEREMLVFECPFSCSKCIPSSVIPCFDDNSLFVGKLQVIPNCEAATERNSGCGEGPLTRHADSSLDNYGVNGDQLMQLLQSQCRLSCGYCLPEAPVVEYVPVLYLIHSNPSISGEYRQMLNTSCNTTPRNQSLPVYNRTVSAIPFVNDPAFIYNDGNGRWVASTTLVCNTSSDVMKVTVRSTHEKFYSTPQETLQWSSYDIKTDTYNPDVEARVQQQGCPGEAQCLLLNCQEPLAGYKCHECSLDCAELTCSSNSYRYMLLLMIISLVSLAAVCAVHIRNVFKNRVVVEVQPTTIPENKNNFSFNGCILTYRAMFIVHMSDMGRSISSNRISFLSSVLAMLFIFAACGLPVFELNDGGSYSSDWAPQGGRLETELAYVKKWTEDSKRSHYIQILLGPSDTSKNALEKKYAISLLSVLKEIVKITVPITYTNSSGNIINTNLGWDDFCTSIDHPALSAIIPGTLPCINPSVLNCFYEGSWQLSDEAYANLELAYRFSTQLPSTNGTITSYKDRPSIYNLTDAEVLERYSDSSKCDDWAKSTTLGRSEMFGAYVDDGIPRTPGGEASLISAERIGATILQYSAKRAREFKATLQQVDERTVENAMDDWFDAIHDRLHEIDDDDVHYPGISVAAFMSVSVERMYAEIGKLRIKDLSLCIGMMIIFAVSTQYSKSNPTDNHSFVAFIGIILVLITMTGSYGFLSLCGVKFDHTMLQALPFIVLGLGVDDMFLLLHYFRCVPEKISTPTEDVIAQLLSAAGVSITLTSFCNAFAFASGIITPIPALRTFLTSAAVCVIFNYISMVLAFPALLAYECDRIKQLDHEKSNNKKSLFSLPKSISNTLDSIPSMQHIIETKYCAAAQKMSFKVVVTMLNVVLFVAMVTTLSTSHPLDFGYNIVELTPRGTYLSKGFKEYEKYFVSQINNHDMIVTDIAMEEKQTELWFALKELKNSTWATTDVDTSVSWLEWFLRYASFSGKVVYDDPSQEGKSFNGAHTRPEDFYVTYHSWRNPFVGGLDAITAQTCDDFGFRWGLDSYLPGNTLNLSRTSYALNMQLLKTPSQWLRHIDDFHDIMEKWLGEGKAFPDPSGDYLRMEQFAGLVESFWTEVGIGATMIVITAIIVPVSFRGAFVIGATAVVVTIEVTALLMLLGVSFSPLVATVLLMAMGISVEFSAHVVVAYENCRSTDSASRIKSSISHTFIPVVEGGISSFLSFSLLGLSEFPYIFRYFFLTFLMVVLVGLLHGLLFLPALMGLVGSCDKEKIVESINRISIVPVENSEVNSMNDVSPKITGKEIQPLTPEDERPQNPLDVKRPLSEVQSPQP